MMPFPGLKYAVPEEQRIAYMREAAKHGFGRLYAQKMDLSKRISLVCYGPTLKDTLARIPKDQPIMSCSGAHDVLIAAGRVPTWHVDCDPRKHKAQFVRNAHPGVHYLMASNCHPQTWEYLRGQRVSLWHMHNGTATVDWIAQNDPGSVVVEVGSTVGLRAMHVAGVMGFARFDIFGMDACFKGEEFRAGPSNAPPQKIVWMQTPDGRKWKTTNLMANSIMEFVRGRAVFGFEASIYGDSLLAAVCQWARERELGQWQEAA